MPDSVPLTQPGEPTTTAAGPLPIGYGASVATNGLGQELWRFLICERCGSLVANEPRYVQLHDHSHEAKP